MIILTVSSEQEKKVYRFSCDRVSIGSAPNGEGRLQLQSEKLNEEHVRIEQKGRGFVIYNVANDPFVVLNELPFGKNKVKNGDRLQVGKTAVTIEVRSSLIEERGDAHSLSPSLSTEQLQEVVEKKVDRREERKRDSLLPVAREDATLEEINRYLESLHSCEGREDEEDYREAGEKYKSNEKFEDLDIESLVKEVEKLELPTTGREIGRKEGKTTSLNGLGTVKEGQRTTSVVEEKSLHQLAPLKAANEEPRREKRKNIVKAPKWKMWTALFILFIATCALVFKGTYIQLKEASHRNEIEAAREVSDVALALTFAQINHVQPQQQNWSDPIFLTNSIRSVLTDQHKPYGTIDTRGRIVDGNYLLRIYNNHDMTRFIIIAQPEPSLSQWLVPQKAIVIDSTSMVLHRLRDLRPINRLLVNVNSLSGENGKAISDLIKSEEVLPLSALADKHNQNGFAPPKQLELMRIGAENYVYNAPRYSQVGERVMEMAIDLVSRPASTQELKKLAEETKFIAKLPNVVIYTSRGMKAALKAQKALSTLLPDQNHLIGYLQFDERGNMKGSHLIFDLEGTKRAKNNNQLVEVAGSKSVGDVGIGYQPLVLAANAKEYIGKSSALQSSNSFSLFVDRENPLFHQAESIARERENKLQKVGKQLIEAVERNSGEFIEEPQQLLQRVFSSYLKETERQNRIVVEKLNKLYEEYSQMPMAEFAEYLKAVGLPSQYTNGGQKMAKRSEISTKNGEGSFEEELAKIGTSIDFKELYNHVAHSSIKLRAQEIPNAAMLISRQNRLRSRVLQKLHQFLFSKNHILPREEFTEENRMRLSQILVHAWVSDPEEQNYYLSEFDKQ